MTLKMEPCAPFEAARQMNPLALAYIGDAVHALLSRTSRLEKALRLSDMHRLCTAEVNAQAQCRALQRIQDRLTPEEADIVRRGRNAHPHHSVPHSASSQEYSAATALEALYGYLFITGQAGRLQDLFEIGREEEESACPKPD
jgi:ribonuclease-3 family protein